MYKGIGGSMNVSINWGESGFDAFEDYQYTVIVSSITNMFSVCIYIYMYVYKFVYVFT